GDRGPVPGSAHPARLLQAPELHLPDGRAVLLELRLHGQLHPHAALSQAGLPLRRDQDRAPVDRPATVVLAHRAGRRVPGGASRRPASTRPGWWARSTTPTWWRVSSVWPVWPAPCSWATPTGTGRPR